MPPVPNVASKVPSVLKRAITLELVVVELNGLYALEKPVSRYLPFASISKLSTPKKFGPAFIITLPSKLKLVSRLPSLL